MVFRNNSIWETGAGMALVVAGIAVILGAALLKAGQTKQPIKVTRHGLIAEESLTIPWQATHTQLAVQGVLTEKGVAKAIPAPWDPQSTVVYTDYKLQVEDVWFQEPGNQKVNKGDTIAIRVLGGSVGNVTVEDDFAPRVDVGDRTVMFLFSEREDRITGNVDGSHWLASGPGTFTLDATGVAHRDFPVGTTNFFTLLDLKASALRARGQ